MLKIEQSQKYRDEAERLLQAHRNLIYKNGLRDRYILTHPLFQQAENILTKIRLGM